MRKFVILFVLLFVANIVGAQVSHSFTFNTVDFTISVDKEDYAHIQSQNLDGFLSQEGAPKLPVLSKRFVLPAGSTLTGINIDNGGTVLLSSDNQSGISHARIRKKQQFFVHYTTLHYTFLQFI